MSKIQTINSLVSRKEHRTEDQKMSPSPDCHKLAVCFREKLLAPLGCIFFLINLFIFGCVGFSFLCVGFL